MKKLILTAGIAGILVASAMASSGPTITAPISVTVDTYATIAWGGSTSFGFHVTDGGYSPTYYSSYYTGTAATSGASFTCVCNTGYQLNACVSGATYSFDINLDGSGYGSATASNSNSATVSLLNGGGSHLVDVALNGVPAGTGLAPTNGAVSGGTLVVQMVPAS